MSLGAGKFDKLISIKSLSQTKDTEGGMVDTWAPFLSDIWARVANMSGSERAATAGYGGKAAEARTEFTIRYRPGLNEKMRIEYRGKLYNIKHIKDYEEQHIELVITCDTGLNDGR